MFARKRRRPNMQSRRQFLPTLAATALLLPLWSAAQESKGKKTIKLNFGVINYTTTPFTMSRSTATAGVWRPPISAA
jgi:hypothetical protein